MAWLPIGNKHIIPAGSIPGQWPGFLLLFSDPIGFWEVKINSTFTNNQYKIGCSMNFYKTAVTRFHDESTYIAAIRRRIIANIPEKLGLAPVKTTPIEKYNRFEHLDLD